MTDIDVVLTRSIDHLVDHREPFIDYQPRAAWGTKRRIAGGLYLMDAGAFPEVYDDFDGYNAIRAARRAGYRGSDQAWISYKLRGKAALWPDDSGIYSVRDFKEVPEDAALIQFNGPRKPWTVDWPWVQKHWS